MVVGIVSSVLLVLIAAACCLWKWRVTRERTAEDGGSQGFDNIAFRDVRQAWGAALLGAHSISCAPHP